MADLILPINASDPTYQTLVTLSDIDYIFGVKWNVRGGYWVLTISDSENNLIASTKITENYTLFNEIINNNLPPGFFYCLGVNAGVTELTRENLGTDFFIIYNDTPLKGSLFEKLIYSGSNDPENIQELINNLAGVPGSGAFVPGIFSGFQGPPVSNSLQPGTLKLIYESNKDGFFNIYYADLDGSNETQLTFYNTPGSIGAFNATVHPLAEKLAFEYNNGTFSQIYELDLITSALTQITTNTGSSPRYSQDGTKLFYRFGDQSINWFNFGETESATSPNVITVPVNIGYDIGVNSNFQKICFTWINLLRRDIWTVNFDGSGFTAITNNSRNPSVFSSDYHPTLDRVVWSGYDVADPSDVGLRRIFELNPANISGALNNIAETPGSNIDITPRYSYDGNFVYYIDYNSSSGQSAIKKCETLTGNNDTEIIAVTPGVYLRRAFDAYILV